MNRKKSGGIRSGVVAKMAGVSRDTLRTHERKGIIGKPRRSSNNYREYGPEVVARVRTARHALALGYTLDELSEIFRTRDAGGVPCRRVRDLAAEKLARVEDAIRNLQKLRKLLGLVLKDWDAALVRADGGKANLLDRLHHRKARLRAVSYHATMPLRAHLRKGRSTP